MYSTRFNSLKSLTKLELHPVSACKTSKIIKKGEALFEEGDSMNGVFCVKYVICKLSKRSANGKDQIVKLVAKGDLLWQRSLVGDETSKIEAGRIVL